MSFKAVRNIPAIIAVSFTVFAFGRIFMDSTPAEEKVETTATSKTATKYPFSKEIQKLQTPPDSNGQFMRIQIISTQGKYPIRVKEILKKDPTTHTEKVISRTDAAADHFIVKVRDGIDEEELRTLAKSLGTFILSKSTVPNMYLVGFTDVAAHSLDEKIAAFKRQSHIVKYVEADQILSIQ